MTSAVKISLISKTYNLNAIGVPVATEEKIDVFAIKSSVNRSEFYDAGQIGLKPQACFTVRITDYHDEEELEADGERWSIYRTYDRVDGRVELYVGDQKGQK